MREAVKVVPDYHSAVNEIVEPDKVLVLTRYFVRRWMPALGDNGTRIVLALRSLGYYNRHTGETRDGIEIELPELAALCGISVPTLKREFGERHGPDRRPIAGTQQNPALHRFVKKDRQYWREPVTNRLLRTANVYRVMMDDPLHDDDLPRLQEVLAAREKGGTSPAASKAQSEPKPPRRRGQPPASTAQSESPDDENESNGTHSQSGRRESESRTTQSEPTLIEDSSVPKLPSRTSLDAAGAATNLSPSVFKEGAVPERAIPAKKGWTDLSPAEQQPFRDRARGELHRYAVEAGAERWARIGPRQEEVRARGLYEAARKVGSG